jgi:hypothetical protein
MQRASSRRAACEVDDRLGRGQRRRVREGNLAPPERLFEELVMVVFLKVVVEKIRR